LKTKELRKTGAAKCPPERTVDASSSYRGVWYTRLVKSLLHASAALVLIAALLGFLGLPVCYSTACPMSGAERAVCKAMGRECCGTKGGQVSHAPAVHTPVLAAGPAVFSLAAPAIHGAAARAELDGAIASPAILQGVGLFTLFAVFLI